MRLMLALLAGKTVRFLSRGLHLGAGTNYPGYIAQKIDPKILRKIDGKLAKTLITGTNGKTTTANMLASIFSDEEDGIIHNNLGANLIGGITTALVEKTTLLGKTCGTHGIFETDEATVPQVISDLRPQNVIVTNIFRDQLDRYGEIQNILRYFEDSFNKLPPESNLILNADDPLVAHLGSVTDLNTFYYGLSESQGRNSEANPDEPPATGPEQHHTQDVLNCMHCGGLYTYSKHFLEHLGLYHCQKCGTSRPEPDISAKNIELGPRKTNLELSFPQKSLAVTLKMPALYNVYNLLAAASAAYLTGSTPKHIVQALELYRPVFGRMEKIKCGNTTSYIILVKNPAGYNEVLRSITTHEDRAELCLLINDNQADGEDISWLWDVNFEQLNKLDECRCTVAGLRGADMALRLKYAGLEDIELCGDIGAAFTRANDLQEEGTLFILPSYTALLELKSYMEKKGLVHSAWGERK